MIKPIKTKELTPAPWHDNQALNHILHLLNDAQVTTRIVGGAVRNALLGIPIGDIDLATSIAPSTLIEKLEAKGIRTIPTGIKHGTVSILYDDNIFEVTSLRKDVKTYGRHADIEATDCWYEDAKRRDFTVNALYADFDGTLYDPCGGLADIKPLKFRFIGDARERIAEDILRILRFFRFHACYGNGDYDSDSLQACIEAAEKIPTLPVERVREEMLKLLGGKNILPTLQKMQETGVLSIILPEYSDMNPLIKLLAHEKNVGENDPLRRLAFLTATKGDLSQWPDLAKRWKLSNEQSKRFAINVPQDWAVFEKNWQGFSYWHGRQKLCDQYFLLSVFDARTAGTEFYSQLKTWQPPNFPVSGQDLMALGFEQGEILGATLKTLERKWVENHFQPNDKAEIIEKLLKTNGG